VTFPATTYYPTKDVAKGTGELFDNATFGYRAKAATAARQTYLTPTERTSWDAALKTWWNASRNPRWTGIMDSSLRVDRATTGNATAMAAQRYEFSTAANPTKFGEPKRDQLPVWLVSGNEKFTINQETGAVTDQAGTIVATGTYPTGYLTPDSVLPDPATNSSVVWLVGEGSATTNATSADGLDGRVKVRKQQVIAPTGGNGTLAGHYAYWVGDESTKANFAARDKTSTNDATYPNDLSISSKEYRNRLQVPQRIGWENISGFGNATFAPNDPYLENISTSKEIGLLQATKNDAAKTQQIKDAAKNNFHSLTAFSKSLLTDAALGGFKKDLTPLLEGTGGPAPNKTIMDAARYLASDPRIGASNTGFPATATNLPVWQDIKTWHDAMGAGGGSVVPQPGMAPVFANFQLFFAITHDADRLQFHMVPMIALWNPYDATLASIAYTLQWRHNFVITNLGFAVNNPACPATPAIPDAQGTKIGNYFVSPFARTLGWFTDPNKYSTWAFENQAAYWTLAPAGPRPIAFSPFDKKSTAGGGLPAPDNASATWVTYQFTTSFAPGEVKVFTVDGTQPVADPAKLHDGSTIIRLKNGFDKDFPSSYYFDFAKNLQREPGDPATTPSVLATNADQVRWYGKYGYGASPMLGSSIRLKVGATTLWTNYSSGMPSPDNGHLDGNIEGKFGGLAVPASDPSKWRTVSTLAAWPGIAKGLKNSLDHDSAIVGLYRSYMNPFLTGPEKMIAGPGAHLGKYLESGICQFYRAFAVFNPFAANGMDLIQDLDYARAGKFAAENKDEFSTLRPLNGDPSSMLWDNNNTSGINGFAAFHWQSADLYNNQGLSTLSARLVRPAEMNTISLGQLQQVNLGRFFWQPSFVVGNSEASPYVDRSKAAGLQQYPVATVTAPQNADKALWTQPLPLVNAATHPNNIANQYVDLSYLVNENLWDSYFLSTVPQSAAIAKDNSTPLNNGRHRFRADITPTDAEARNHLTSAAFLENYGALNVNSTSVESWISLFTAFRGLKVTGDGASNPNSTVPITRTLSPSKGPVRFSESSSDRVKEDYGANSPGNRNYEKLLLGFRHLTDTQIQTLSERIVDEIRLRGPFLSLADFVNRRLVSPQGANSASSEWYKARTLDSEGSAGPFIGRIGNAYDPFVGLSGINGALQRAINVSGINGGMNYPTPADANDRVYGVQTSLTAASASRPMQLFSDYQFYLDTEHLAGVPVGEVGQLLSHSPGFVSQGDLLAMIGPALTPRGDTFLVRTYGDVVDRTGRVLSRAYIEAVVQRMPEPVSPAGTTGVDKWRYTDKFGRKFKVVNLRWLRPEEI
jgi:hypothetical protein